MRARSNSRPNKRQQAHRFGLSAERKCAWVLRLKGYRVLSTRYKNPLGEIDILARKSDTLVVVEVKARNTLAACEISITPDKRRRLVRAAQGLLANPNRIRGLRADTFSNIRFDVMWVVPRRWPRHIQHAWEVDNA